MPQMNDLVPSIGSSTQTYSASARSSPNSSPMMPWSGKVRRMSVRIAVSAARSAAVTGSKLPRRPLSSMLSAVRKNGRMVSPDTDRELVHESRKVDRRHAPRPHRRHHSTYRRLQCPATAARLAGPAAPCDLRSPARARPARGRVHEHSKRFAHGDLGRRHHARRHARLDLYRQPVPAQFDWRHRAQPRRRARAFAGRDRAAVEHVLFRLRRRANSRGHGARPIRAAALPRGGRGHHGGRRRRIRVGCQPRRSDLRPCAARARNGGLAGGVARGLCQAVSARSLCHAHRPADRSRHHRDAHCDRTARFFNGDDRLAREFSRRRSVHLSGRTADCGRGQGRRALDARPAGDMAREPQPASLPSCARRRSDDCSS